MPPVGPRVVTPTKAKRKSAKPARNRLEISPNNRATCGACGIKIQKGIQRASITEPNNLGYFQKVFYHADCLTAQQRTKLPTPEKQAEQDLFDERVSRESPDLKDKLKKLRRKLQQENYYKEAYQVFNNETLDQLLLVKPTTPEALLNIKGIGQRRLAQYGDEILALMRQHFDDNVAAIRLDLEEHEAAQHAAAFATAVHAAAGASIKIEDNDNEEQDMSFNNLAQPRRRGIAQQPPQKAIQDMKGKEIRLELQSYGVETKHLIERADYENELQKARNSRGRGGNHFKEELPGENHRGIL